MAHSSTREKGILQMKKYRQARGKRKIEENKKQEAMTATERDEYINKKSARSLKSQVQSAVWDYEHLQYPMVKYPILKQLLEDRKTEILKTLDVTADDELKKIELILNGIRM